MSQRHHQCPSDTRLVAQNDSNARGRFASVMLARAGEYRCVTLMPGPVRRPDNVAARGPRSVPARTPSVPRKRSARRADPRQGDLFIHVTSDFGAQISTTPPARPQPPPPLGLDEPLRLDVAAAKAFPDGSMSKNGLRREARRGRLVIQRIAGKDYTTLRAIGEMRELCRVEVKDRDSGLSPPAGTSEATSRIIRPGSSETEATNTSLALMKAKLSKHKKRSPSTSSESTTLRASATVIRLNVGSRT